MQRADSCLFLLPQHLQLISLHMMSHDFGVLLLGTPALGLGHAYAVTDVHVQY